MDKEYLIQHSALEANILPITSRCDASCVFCSHKNNPPGIRVMSIADRTVEEAERTMSFLNGRNIITIGESATGINEGEPLCHPDFTEIMTRLRKRFPNTPISITTNGHHLDEEMVIFLKQLYPLVINLSINSATIPGRKALMGDDGQQAEATIEGVKLLARYGIVYHGSIVAMPHIVGWEDIELTVRYLAGNGATSVRLFMPGYAGKAAGMFHFDRWKMFEDIRGFIGRVGDTIRCPLLLEPSYVKDLSPVLSGVLNGSPASAAGLVRGDTIISINDLRPRSRAEAWNMLQRPGLKSVGYLRNGMHMSATWENKPFRDAGVIMEHDFDMERLDEIIRLAEGCGGRILALASELGWEVLSASPNAAEST
ncbi:MAG: radical SAM protein, partial [Clostridiales bacterium]|nr:radical SAM protein [Clostridiales bacterium]